MYICTILSRMLYIVFRVNSTNVSLNQVFIYPDGIEFAILERANVSWSGNDQIQGRKKKFLDNYLSRDSIYTVVYTNVSTSRTDLFYFPFTRLSILCRIYESQKLQERIPCFLEIQYIYTKLQICIKSLYRIQL